MTQTHENVPSDRDHANVRFFPPLAYAVPMAAGLATTAVVRHGPFRFSRNPMYLSLTGLYVGIAVSVNALWVTVLLPVALVSIMVGVIAREESYLERKFGTEYTRYKTTVRRWL